MGQVELLIVIVMVMVNAVFAGFEIALASVSMGRLQSLVEQGARGAVAALEMKRGIERSLAVVQLGITLVGLIAGATGGATAADDIAPYFQSFGIGETLSEFVAICLVVGPLTAITIVVGELLPKLFSLRNKEWVCLALSPTMRFFAWIAMPIVWGLEASATGLMEFSERFWRPTSEGDFKSESAELQELRAIANLARTSRLIGDREERIILGAARIASRQLREIALPAEHIRMLKLESSLQQSLLAAHIDLHTRFPVAEDIEDPQSIVGYVTFKDIVNALKVAPNEPSVRGIIRPIPSLSASSSIANALELLLKEYTHIALVREVNGQVIGMVTLEDIVEELVGDIQDEHDLLPVHVVRSGAGWIVGGNASLDRIREVTSISLNSSGHAHNLNGWLIERLGHEPSGSEVVFEGRLRVLVRKVRRKRVLEAVLGSDGVIQNAT